MAKKIKDKHNISLFCTTLLIVLAVTGCHHSVTGVSLKNSEALLACSGSSERHFEICNMSGRSIYIYDVTDDFPAFIIQVMQSNKWVELPLKGMCGTDQDRIELLNRQNYQFSLNIPTISLPWRLGVQYDVRKNSTGSVTSSSVVWTSKIMPRVETFP